MQGYIGNTHALQEKSNRRKSLNFQISPELRQWCQNHPTGIWVKGYTYCSKGYKSGEECVKGGE